LSSTTAASATAMRPEACTSALARIAQTLRSTVRTEPRRWPRMSSSCSTMSAGPRSAPSISSVSRWVAWCVRSSRIRVTLTPADLARAVAAHPGAHCVPQCVTRDRSFALRRHAGSPHVDQSRQQEGPAPGALSPARVWHRLSASHTAQG
jgi:hypothetical protein